MPTNTKEYMRTYQRERRAKLKKPLQNIVKKNVKVVKVLHPPPKVEKEEDKWFKEGRRGGGTVVIGDGSQTFEGIDYKAISEASEFRRFIYWIRTGKVFRGSNEALTTELNKTQKDINIIKGLRNTNPHYGDVVKEFKALLQKRRLDNNENV